MIEFIKKHSGATFLLIMGIICVCMSPINSKYSTLSLIVGIIAIIGAILSMIFIDAELK
jgi:lipopolysaccharide export LptBFGC system permease protein LptF